MRLMITGASGLLGNKLTTLAMDEGHEVHPTYYSHPITARNAEQLDITNEKALNKFLVDRSPDSVIHTASITDVDYCERNPAQARLLNGTATRYIAQACKQVGSFLVYLSTDYVFDGKRGTYREDDKPNPINAYGTSKLMGEEEAVHASENLCIVRTSVVYGWGRPSRHNFATWLHQSLSEGKKVNVVTDQHASPTFNTSLAQMLIEVADRRITGILHLAGSTRLSRYEFALRLASRFGFDHTLLQAVESKDIRWVARRPADSSLNVGRAMDKLSNKPIAIDIGLDAFARERTYP